jgi:hypothetical protein
MDEALALPPADIDGFDWLWDGFLKVHGWLGARAWGYIELDQGGAVNKRITRQRLHDEGVNPMPVYHPLNDGWDYFDELASQYDRICMGNVVQASPQLRVRLFHTLAERHRTYPDLWVHCLGMTPNQWANALPFDSCDSSTWLSMVRWGSGGDLAMGKRFNTLTLDQFRYRIGADAFDLDGWHRSRLFVVASAQFQNRGLRHWTDRVHEALDFDLYPHPDLETELAT